MKDGMILIVEDNPDDEAFILRALRKSNIANKIVVARDGAEALDRLFGEGAYEGRGMFRPTVVLLDLKLPKIDGLEVLRRLRADDRTKCLPVVVLTSSDEPDDIVRSYALGANSYVRKPVDFGDFSDAVSQVGLYWMLRSEPVPDTA